MVRSKPRVPGLFLGMATLLAVLALSVYAVQPGVAQAESARTTLRMPFQADVPTLDPGLGEDTTSIEVLEQLFLSLTDFNDKTTEVVPELATSWDVSKDGLTYTFHMRHAKWTDGKPVTAGDIVWAVRRNIKPETASPYAYVLYPIKNAEAINKGKIKDVAKIGVRALDDYTVQFTLEAPAAYFPAIAALWTLSPQPRHTVEQYGDKWTEPEHIVTNGPYRLVSWKKGDKLVLKKNPGYFAADTVKIPEVQYLIIPESSTGLALYDNGDIDFMGQRYLPIPLPDIPRIKADPVLKKQFAIAPQMCTYYYGFNNSRFPTDNVLVRKALSAAIDRQTLVDKVTKGEQIPASTFTRPPIFGSVPPSAGIGIHYDPEQARKWLAEAGYPNGKGFPDVTLMYNTSEMHSQIAQAIQQMWRRVLNVNIKIENQEWKVYLKTIKQKDGPQIYRLGWCADYPDANNWLLQVFDSTKSNNEPKWHNAEFDRDVEKAAVSQDPAERKRLYRRAEEILCQEQAAIAPIYFYTSVTLAKPYLNYMLAPMNGNHIRNWSFKN